MGIKLDNLVEFQGEKITEGNPHEDADIPRNPGQTDSKIRYPETKLKELVTGRGEKVGCNRNKVITDAFHPRSTPYSLPRVDQTGLLQGGGFGV